jgi:predicted RNase H-like nuclease
VRTTGLILPPFHSSNVSTYVGVDGCAGGWFAVEYGGSPDGGVDCGLYDDFSAVVDGVPDADRLLVDMPIGLPETSRRACDVAARGRLGSRASTVFFAPCRAVLDAESHAAASERNRARTGYGLSIQAWHLVPKIREVDEALRSSPRVEERVFEAHPELCFAALGDGPVEAPKSTAAGQRARIDRLRESLPTAEEQYNAALDTFYRKDVGRDDILDALVLALAGSRPLGRLPDVDDAEVPRDAVGLPMEIRFPRTD